MSCHNPFISRESCVVFITVDEYSHVIGTHTVLSANKHLDGDAIPDIIMGPLYV